MRPIAKWRGKAKATECWEARQVFDLADLSEKDIFYDLGCGNGWVCIWAARKCEFAKGIESHIDRVKEANNNVDKSGLKNVKIIKGDLVKYRFPDANVLFCVVDLDLKDFKRWNRRKRKKTLRVVTLGPPPIPIKPVATKGVFCLTKFPFELARTSGEWYSSVLGREYAFWKDIVRKFKRGVSDDTLWFMRRQFKLYFR